jgi:hypothetical protein
MNDDLKQGSCAKNSTAQATEAPETGEQAELARINRAVTDLRNAFPESPNVFFDYLKERIFDREYEAEIVENGIRYVIDNEPTLPPAGYILHVFYKESLKHYGGTPF